MSTEVQTMATFDDGDSTAMQTPLYPIISLFGLLIVIGTFLSWAGDPDNGATTSITGFDAGGWGLSALIIGIVIAALGVLGYFWNPFSDPEAAFIAGFGLAGVVGALLKIADPLSLFVDQDAVVDFFDPSAGIGLWLVLIGSLLSFLGGMWILYSRPKAQANLAA